VAISKKNQIYDKVQHSVECVGDQDGCHESVSKRLNIVARCVLSVRCEEKERGN
jgi:hypothetical protein